MAAGSIVHAFGTDVLAEHDAVALADLLRRKEVGVEEVVDAAIARAGKVAALHAVAHEGFEQARLRSKDPLEGGFAGVPTFIKDNTAIVDMKTDHGSAAVRSGPAERSGIYTKQYMSVGFVCLGKSAMPEFGLNATTEPAHAEPTRNPWNTAYSTGASSGGSAALVAAGVVPIAHANDGGGSIRIPAACCGLVGLKPTRGRHVVPEAGQSMPIDLISEGVVTRSVRDTAAFHAEAEKYYRNAALPPIGQVEGPAARRLRIGVIVDSVAGAPTDAATRAAVEETAQRLAAAGHHVETTPLPVAAQFSDDFLLYWAALAFFLRLGGKRIVDPSFDASRLDGLTLGLSDLFKRGFYRMPTALYRLNKSRHEYSRTFETLDALITPVLAHTTPKLGHLSPTVPFDELMERLRNYASFTPLANVTGGPAISLPVSRTPEGLPIAIQLSAAHGAERTLLELAFELEQEGTLVNLLDIV